MAGRSAVVFLVAALLIASCGGNSDEVPSADRSEPCEDRIPFSLTVLPGGFSTTLEEGPADGQPAIGDTVTYHAMGPEGRYIEVFRAGHRTKFRGGAPIKVMGRNGAIRKIDIGYALKFSTGKGRCSRYQIEGRGVTEGDMRKVAAGITQ